MNFVSALLVLLLAPGSETGDWRTEDGKAIIRVARCGDQLCGNIVRVLDSGAPGSDVNNPNPALRRRPIVGLPVLTGYRWANGAWRNGLAYDAKSGKSYSSSIQLQADGRLGVTGCILFLCQTKYWTRTG